MTDKDLFELAARAAGIRCDLSEPSIITGAQQRIRRGQSVESAIESLLKAKS